MHIVTQFPHKIVEDQDMGVPMPDGCRLSARVWMPEEASEKPFPAILEYIPYRKRDGTIGRDEIMHKYFAGRGYAVVRLDMRGSGESQGLMADEYTQVELDDAVAAIAWIAAQPWCDGNVGMMGKSWGGFNCLQTAAMNPDALRAIITVCSTTDRYADDIHYKGGCLLNDNFAWGSQMWSYSSRPPDPALVGDKWREMWMERLEAEPFLAATWLAHQRRDEYWKHGSVCEDYSAIKIPVLSIGGWADNYMNTVSQLVENLDVPVKGIVGPWVHQYPHTADPGPQIGFLQEAVRWWDHWLKGIATGVENDPAYRAYLQQTVKPARMHKHRDGHWLAESVWPSERVLTQVLPLSGAGVLGGNGGAFETQVNSPLDCGFGVGSFFPMSGDVPQHHADQRDDDARSACFDTDVLQQDLDILGAPFIRLRLSSDKPRAQIAVRLCEVHPDGASGRVTYGVLNLCHRNGHEAPQDIVPGEAFEIALTLDQMAYRIKAGMRLRVAISSAYWPFLWPVAERATLTLLEGALELPVHTGSEKNEWQFDEAEGASPWEARFLRPALYEKTQVTDKTTGEIRLILHDDLGLNEDPMHGLRSGTVTREVWRIHPDDPLCASGDIHWTQELARGDWSIRTETTAKMWSDAETYYLAGRLEAFEGDVLVYERDVETTVPRDFT